MQADSQKIKQQLYFVLGLGILSMALAEAFPVTGYYGLPLAIGVLRAYVIILSPFVKKHFPESSNIANGWMFGSTGLIAFYIYSLFIQEKIDFDLQLSLHTGNIMLVGAEWYYSKVLNKIENDKERLENDRIEKENDLKRKQDDSLQSQIDQLKNQNDSQHQRIVSLESENDGLQLKVDSLKEQNDQDRKLANLIRSEYVNPIQITKTQKTIRCEKCNQNVLFGNAQKEVEHCGGIIYQKETA